MLITTRSGIFYSMRTQRLSTQISRLALAALALVALTAMACNGDDSEPVDGSPSPADSPRPSPNPSVTPGAGDTPVTAVGTYIDTIGLDGNHLDLSSETECPLSEVQTVVAGTPTLISRISLYQYCLASKDWEPDKAITVIVDLPGSGESWEMKLDFDAEVSLWTVKDVSKVNE